MPTPRRGDVGLYYEFSGAGPPVLFIRERVMPKRYFGHAVPQGKTITHEQTLISVDSPESAPNQTDPVFPDDAAKPFDGTHDPKRPLLNAGA